MFYQKQHVPPTVTKGDLIAQGNTFFKQHQYANAITQYSLALQFDGTSPQSLQSQQQQQQQRQQRQQDDENLRALANRSQCYLCLQQYEACINDCLMILNHLDRTHGKTLYRLSRSYHALGLHSMFIYFYLLLEYHHPSVAHSSDVKQFFRQSQNDSPFLSLSHAMGAMTMICDHYVQSTHQLKSIEHATYHDTWQVEDYFDRENQVRKFDVPCPPHLFVKTEGLMLQEMAYEQELRLRIEREKQVDRGEYESKCQQFNLVPYVHTNAERRIVKTKNSDGDSNSSAADDDEVKKNEHRRVLESYYKFSQGTKRLSGFPNMLFATSLSWEMNSCHRPVYMLTLPPETVELPRQFVENQSPPPGAMKRVASVGLKCGNVRCKSVTWYGIARGSVVVRDYDSHCWVSVKLVDVADADAVAATTAIVDGADDIGEGMGADAGVGSSRGDVTSMMEDDAPNATTANASPVALELNIDFVPAQFGYHSVHRVTGRPLRLFTDELNQLEEQMSHEDLRAIYKTKRDRVFWDSDMMQYCSKQYCQDYPISDESRQIFEPMQVSLRQFMLDSRQ